MCKIKKTSFDNDIGSRVKLTSPKVIITLSVSYNNDAKTFNGLHSHPREYQQHRRNQRPSEACGDIQIPHGQKRGQEGLVICPLFFKKLCQMKTAPLLNKHY